ncbi:hypothetical protein GJAV_G00078590 [Gymnothorax javanicus]|nr:hypothetical protein GJAV_G00078590 [Gymnothorax javanicus]
MFALLRNLKELNQTDKPDPPAEWGSGTAGLEESSGAEASVEEVRPEVVTPIPVPQTPHSPAPHPPEKKLEAQNEIPERPWKGPLRNTWAQQLEEGLDGDGLIFSGNGFTELETHHDSLLRSPSALRADLTPPHSPAHEQDQEDIFQAQGYLPFLPQTVKSAAEPGRGVSTQTQAHQGEAEVLPRPEGRDTLDLEGSGLAGLTSISH